MEFDCWLFMQMRGVSQDFKTELGRHNYVTPTSYLELITMFQRLLTAKRVENNKTLSRYTVGLDKLQSSAQQVAGMQQELRVRSLPCPWSKGKYSLLQTELYICMQSCMSTHTACLYATDSSYE